MQQALLLAEKIGKENVISNLNNSSENHHVVFLSYKLSLIFMTAITSYKTIFGFLERCLHSFYIQRSFINLNWITLLSVTSFSFPFWWRFIFLLLSSKECTTVAKCARCPDKINCRRCKPRHYKLRTSSSANSTCVSSCPLGFLKKGRRCQRLAEGKKKQKGSDDENGQWNELISQRCSS